MPGGVPTALTLFDIPRLLGYQFFQYAIVGGVVTSIVCAWIGLFLILRRESMLVDGVAHTSFGGIALGLYLGIDPMLTALFVTILAVLGISAMRRAGMAQSDSATAVVLALGFSTGLVIISLADGFNVELLSYLFGSVLTIDGTDLYLITALALVTAAFLGVFYKELLSITFDEEASRLVGIPVQPLSLAYNVLIAVAIVLSIKVIGIILVVALIVLPGLTALQMGLSFRGTTVAAIAVGVISVVTGLLLSAVYDVATSGVIIFTMTGIFLFAAAYRRLG
ncbi:MAG: metal ABC transporter permease [Thermoplasmata archaeon]|nr:metal ABC transporter permease [Thermoplasmata archaeon]